MTQVPRGGDQKRQSWVSRVLRAAPHPQPPSPITWLRRALSWLQDVGRPPLVPQRTQQDRVTR